MKVLKHRFRNIGPYGNNWQEIKFSEEGSLNMIVGKNGEGKCVYRDTMIDIEFDNPKTLKRFEKFLDEE